MKFPEMCDAPRDFAPPDIQPIHFSHIAGNCSHHIDVNALC